MNPRAGVAFKTNDTLPSCMSRLCSVAVPDRKRSVVPPWPSTTATSPSVCQVNSCAQALVGAIVATQAGTTHVVLIHIVYLPPETDRSC